MQLYVVVHIHLF